MERLKRKDKYKNTNTKENTQELTVDESAVSSNNPTGKTTDNGGVGKNRGSLPAISASDSDSSEEEAIVEVQRIKKSKAQKKSTKLATTTQNDSNESNIVTQPGMGMSANVSTINVLPPTVTMPLQTTQSSPGPAVDQSGETKLGRSSNVSGKEAAMQAPAVDRSEITDNPRYDPTTSTGTTSCPLCFMTLSSVPDLLLHISMRHAPIDSFSTTAPQIQDAERQFITIWSAHNAAALSSLSTGLTTSSSFLSKVPPRLFVFDDGICSSFRFMTAVEARYLPEVRGYAWYDEIYDIILPFPASAVVRIVLDTDWAMVSDETLPIKLTTLLPTLSNVGLLRQVLTVLSDNSKYNPVWARANVIVMGVKFILANLVINRSSSWAQDSTPSVSGRLLRTVPGKPEYWPLMYPRRTLNANVSKISRFVEQTQAERTGRVDRAMLYQGEKVIYTDVAETCDTLTVRLRDMWTGKIFKMHYTHSDIALALSECARVVSFSAVMALSPRTILPCRATTDERKLAQVLNIARLGDLRLRIEPIIQSAADTLRSVTMLEINPKILTAVLNRICENQTQSVTVTGTILRLLSSATTDSSAFWTCIASWLYNGIVTTTLRQQDYPNPTASITDYTALWSALIVSLVSPLTNDPNAPVKIFMTMANLFNGYERIPMNNASMTQGTPPWAFNNPNKWPACFIQPRNINQNIAPFMRAWADLIHRYWPQPGVVNYGSPHHLGATELLVEDGQIVTPLPVQPQQFEYAALDRDNEMSTWINQVCNFFIRCINGTDLRTASNQATQQALISAISQLKTSPSLTYGYMSRYLPYELAMISPTLALPPFQIPFQRLNVNDIVYQIGVRRHVVRDQVEPALDTSSTLETIGQLIEIDAQALLVSLLSGTMNAKVLPSVHYAEKITPLYMDDDFFAPHQRAVVVSEAYSLVRTIISQISDTRGPQLNPLAWIPAPNASSPVSAEVARLVNDMIKEAFDMPGELLEGLIGYGDPRYTQVEIVAQRCRAAPLRFEPLIPPSVLAQELQLVENVITAEPNLFGLATGDLYLERIDTSAGFSGLNVIGWEQWDANTPGVIVAGSSLLICSGFNGVDPMIMDADGVERPITGRWVVTLEAWRSSVVTVQKLLLPRIRAGKLAVRILVGIFPYTINYYEPAVGIDEWKLLSDWASMCEPTGIPAIPFTAPVPSDVSVVTAACVKYLRCSTFNEGSLMATNAGSPRTVFGQSVEFDIGRWMQLCDLNTGVDEIQLPNMIEFYQIFRRYNITQTELTQVVTLTGTLTHPVLN
uniref:Core shell protein n=1 Tax=Piscine orthoreovirus TaxID=1157337 RepID=A0A0S2EGN1_9REOV|nr:core shell protein [Piscine orthoreovirus]